MNIYSDEALKSELNSGLRGIARRAQILLEVPEEIRAQAVAEAHRIMNAVGGRPTEALVIAVREVKAGA